MVLHGQKSKKRTIIIPKGVVNPDQTNIIEIDLNTIGNNNLLIALPIVKYGDEDNQPGSHSYSRRLFSNSRQEHKIKDKSNLSRLSKKFNISASFRDDDDVFDSTIHEPSQVRTNNDYSNLFAVPINQTRSFSSKNFNEQPTFNDSAGSQLFTATLPLHQSTPKFDSNRIESLYSRVPPSIRKRNSDHEYVKNDEPMGCCSNYYLRDKLSSHTNCSTMPLKMCPDICDLVSRKVKESLKKSSVDRRYSRNNETFCRRIPSTMCTCNMKEYSPSDFEEILPNIGSNIRFLSATAEDSANSCHNDKLN